MLMYKSRPEDITHMLDSEPDHSQHSSHDRSDADSRVGGYAAYVQRLPTLCDEFGRQHEKRMRNHRVMARGLLREY